MACGSFGAVRLAVVRQFEFVLRNLSFWIGWFSGCTNFGGRYVCLGIPERDTSQCCSTPRTFEENVRLFCWKTGLFKRKYRALLME